MDNCNILSIVSGKGGVGKTMLSVAIANEISRSRKVLLFDLDFFNRGLSGLFASAIDRSSSKVKLLAPDFVARPQEQNPDSPKTETDWFVSEVKDNLFVISYGDLEKRDFNFVETLDVQKSSESLRHYVNYLANELSCEYVVLDCHGGPDNMSFAACKIADFSILVSEPDRITLHGTLNFLRALRKQLPGKDADIRLVLNKVVPAFSSIFLFRFYDKYLRKEFNGHDLLAIYPLEIYLTKAFERTPFLTSAYPSSQLTVKTRLLLYLLYPNRLEKPPALRLIHFAFDRYYLGRLPAVLNYDFVLKIFGIYIIIVLAIPFLISLLYPRLFRYPGAVWDAVGFTEDSFLIPLWLLSFWFLTTLILGWTRELDRFGTFSIRTNSLIYGVGAFSLLMALWILVSIALGKAIYSALFSISIMPLRAAILILTAIALAFLVFHAERGLRTLQIERNYGEGSFRIGFSIFNLIIILWNTVRGLGDQ